jgi:sulfatase modifying factor 1
MNWIPGGDFVMGSELPDYAEEGPPQAAVVDGFWIDRAPVTNAQFRRFVKKTGYVTLAEQQPQPADFPGIDPHTLHPGSLVFQPTDGPVDLTDLTAWWRYVRGANWQHPEGPASTIESRELHPVVHVGWPDACAYAEWAGKDLPTEAEWEFAARGGLESATYAWGEEFMPSGRLMANIWVGEFPWQNLKPAGRRRTSPVGDYPANGYGLVDVAGNVWEWTSDVYRLRGATAPEKTHACCAPAEPERPTGPESKGIVRRVIKGGSHLCAPNYCRRYRPAARQAQQVESPMSHLGFRCVLRP